MIVADGEVSEQMAEKVLDHGFFLARRRNDILGLVNPSGFEPRSFQSPGEPAAGTAEGDRS